jgi:hypothetical protein
MLSVVILVLQLRNITEKRFKYLKMCIHFGFYQLKWLKIITNFKKYTYSLK